jgi:hypothetical protein
MSICWVKPSLPTLSKIWGRWALTQTRLTNILKMEDKLLEDDLHVNLTIYSIPASLIKEFVENVARPNYPGGMSSAIIDLMRKTVGEHRAKEGR